jgi:hypothetical protein
MDLGLIIFLIFLVIIILISMGLTLYMKFLEHQLNEELIEILGRVSKRVKEVEKLLDELENAEEGYDIWMFDSKYKRKE